MYNKSYLFNKKNNYYEGLSTEYFIKTSIKIMVGMQQKKSE